jgi:hypothetical protein
MTVEELKALAKAWREAYRRTNYHDEHKEEMKRIEQQLEAVGLGLGYDYYDEFHISILEED